MVVSKYDTLVKPRLDEIKAERAKGSSVDDIIAFLGVSRSSFYNWLNKHDELQDIMTEAEILLSGAIENQARHSLIDKLRDRLETTEEIYEDGVLVKEKKTLLRADTTAIIFALKATNPKQWDPLGVARIEQQEEDVNLAGDILKALSKYTPKDKNNEKG